MNSRALRWLIAGLLALLAVAAAVHFLGRQPAVAAASRAEPVVELAAGDVLRAEARALQRGLPISGSLKAVNSAMVKARIGGELTLLAVREGDEVRAGQVIAQVDATEVQARLAQAREQAGAARAQIEIAQRQFDNNKALVDQGFISRTALESSQSNLNAARATHQAAVAAVEVTRKSVQDAVLRSPIDGVVSQRLAQPGERVGIDTRVVEIVDLRSLELEATLPAADSVQVRVGQRALLAIEGAAGPVAATVARINPSAQAGSRSVLVYLAVAGTPGLRQGLFAQGQLGTGEATALAVPLASVRTDKPAPYVQTVENGRVAHRPVQPGARGEADGQALVAVEGLAPGSMVLQGHVGLLREGTAVRFTGGPKNTSP